mmetsp:Transcript_34922/g.96450  ORF Transcript_34922/g.96450 Transcript_34922/m.96450 type:complete len:209 (+) Transcript_34922:422-1048(+)
MNGFRAHGPPTVAEGVDAAQLALVATGTHLREHVSRGGYRRDEQLVGALKRSVRAIVRVIPGRIADQVPGANVVRRLHTGLADGEGFLQGLVPRWNEFPSLYDLQAQLPVLLGAFVVYVPSRHDTRIVVQLLDAQNVGDALHRPCSEARDDREMDFVHRRDERLLLCGKALEKQSVSLGSCDRQLLDKLPCAGALARDVCCARSIESL